MEESLVSKGCKPCQGSMPAMTSSEAHKYLSKVMQWELIEDKKIRKEFKFKDFKASLDFVNKVGALAENEGHHPSINIIYNKVIISLTTHAIQGLSENDFIMAAKIDNIFLKKAG
jgi:4a-hydroxytetrahydrobiopterin dehydratase